MIISRPDARVREVACDECAAGSEEISFDEAESFPAFVSEIKKRGWRMRRAGLAWEHLCPECS